MRFQHPHAGQRRRSDAESLRFPMERFPFFARQADGYHFVERLSDLYVDDLIVIAPRFAGFVSLDDSIAVAHHVTPTSPKSRRFTRRAGVSAHASKDRADLDRLVALGADGDEVDGGAEQFFDAADEGLSLDGQVFPAADVA